jgi:hypothetical protein|tara:strand:- start:560 stop:805 length:246 start_codon:yes stop_codon:yes gene_type:complete
MIDSIVISTSSSSLLVSFFLLFVLFLRQFAYFPLSVILISRLEVCFSHLLPTVLLFYGRNFFSCGDGKQLVLGRTLLLSVA